MVGINLIRLFSCRLTENNFCKKRKKGTCFFNELSQARRVHRTQEEEILKTLFRRENTFPLNDCCWLPPSESSWESSKSRRGRGNVCCANEHDPTWYRCLQTVICSIHGRVECRVFSDRDDVRRNDQCRAIIRQPVVRDSLAVYGEGNAAGR